MEKIALIIGLAFLGLFLVGFMSIIFAFPCMLLWNWLMPEIFGLPEIGYLQALGLMILSSFLVKGGAAVTAKD